MTRQEMLLRIGFYAGMISRELGDDSYALRFLGHAQDITDEIYHAMIYEITTRLIAAGKLRPDEDAFETELHRNG